MKIVKISLVLGLFVSLNYANAQMIIGNPANANSNNNSVILDFEKTNNRGILLPVVTTLPTNPVDGTFVVDASTKTNARVKIRQNGAWVDLSNNYTANNSDVTSYLNTRGSLNEANCAANPANCKVILGANTSSADGVLVLESTTKAMVLPIVTSTNNIKNPSPGMMAYVTGTNGKDLLAVFNGKEWSFWKYSLPVITIDPPVTE